MVCPYTLKLDGLFYRNDVPAIVIPWIPHGNINEYLANHPNADRFRLFLCVVKGVKYLHDCNIAHGDIKGISPPTRAKDPIIYLSCSQPNILITDSAPPRAMLADFGFTRITAVVVDGTTSFTAPELLLPTRFGLGKGVPSKEADIYALDMTMYQVLKGKRPLSPRREAEVIHAVVSGERPLEPENAERIGMTEVMWDLVRERWREDRMTRPNISDILRKICGITCERKTPESIVVTESWELTEAEVDDDHDLGKKLEDSLSKVVVIF